MEGMFDDGDIPPVRGMQSARSGQPYLQRVGAVNASGRLQRSADSRRLPQRFRDQYTSSETTTHRVNIPTTTLQDSPLNEHVELVNPAPQPSHGGDAHQLPDDPENQASERYKTAKNAFGVYREYYQRPQKIPDAEVTLADVSSDAVLPPASQDVPVAPPTPSLKDAIHPFPNASTYLVSNWHANLPSGSLSLASVQRLIDNVFLSKAFKPADFVGVKMAALNKNLDALDADPDDEGVLEQLRKDGWQKKNVRIRVPTGDKSGDGAKSVVYDSEVLLYRSLVEIIKAAFKSPQSRNFHYEPFFAYHTQTNPDGLKFDERIYDELYASDAWMEEHIAISKLEGDDLPRAIAALMFASDATHVSQFGQSKMWPLYLFFGNLSKWFRCKPSTHSCHHVAHIPSVSALPVILDVLFNFPDSFLSVSER
jgi:Plavaka transposase